MSSSRKLAGMEKEYVKTHTGDLVSLKAHVHGSQNLYLKGQVRVDSGVVVPVRVLCCHRSQVLLSRCRGVGAVVPLVIAFSVCAELL